MKNLIKICIFALLLTSGTESFAQIFGLRAGLNLSNLLIKDDEDIYSENFKMNPGFHFGPTIEVPFSETFSFESGLLFSTKGAMAKESESYMGSSYEYKEKIHLYYLDIPLTAKVTYEAGGLKVFGTFGPYVGLGLSGKIKSEYTEDGNTETDTDDIKFGSDENEDDLRRPDFGLTIGAGIGIKSFEVGLNYNLGLANLSIVDEGGSKIKNRVLGISLAYKFGGNTPPPPPPLP